ncbi:MAG TPA: hypothetical protein VNZ52_04095 [Candidatus Thermoplasmatota archaeon]|nr:hypothetical protein [Candidatus Thermoplasmatota archaeon]
MPATTPPKTCPDCGTPGLRLLGGHLYHCERCRYTLPAPAQA